MRDHMTRAFVGVCVMMSVSAAARQAPPAVNPPARLIAAQQLAMAAYPELRGSGLQVRVDSRPDGSTTITFGPAPQDGDTLLARSRPRTAVLVIDAAFDAQDRLTRAVLRGPLARTKERREARGAGTDIGQALETRGAAYPPTQRAAFLQQLDLDSLTLITGALTASGATFHTGTGDEGLYWEVPATSAVGEPVTLGFEPYAGRLVTFVRGGGQ
jgi:hypothetical protein